MRSKWKSSYWISQISFKWDNQLDLILKDIDINDKMIKVIKRTNNDKQGLN